MPESQPRIYRGAISVAGAAGAGLAVNLVINGITISPVVLEHAGNQAPVLYAAVTVLLLPLVLALGQLGAETRGGLDRAARSGGRVGRYFITNWLLVGGFLALAGLLVRVSRSHLESLADHLFTGQLFSDHLLFDQIPGSAGWSLILVLVLGVALTVGGAGPTSTRMSAAPWLLVLGVAAIVAALFWTSGAGEAAAMPHGPRRDLPAVAALLLAGLWGLLPVFERQHLLRHAETDLPRAAALCWLVPQAVACLVVLFLVRHPQLRPENLPTEIDLVENRTEILLLLLAALLSIAALYQMLKLGARTLLAMARDGLLPAWLVQAPDGGPPVRSAMVLLGAAVAAAFLPQDQLAGLGAFLQASLALLFLLPGALDANRRLASRQAGHLGRAVLATLGAATALFAALALSTHQGWPLATWLLLGFALYFLYARRHAALSLAEEVTIAALAPEEDGERPEHRVLVATGGGGDLENLLAVGAALTRQSGGELIVLRVLVEDREDDLRAAAEDQWRELEARVATELGELRYRTVVRLADSAAAGIREAAEENDVSVVVLGWPAERAGGGGAAVLDRVFRSVGRPLAVVHGNIAGSRQPVRVATAGGRHATAALEVGEAIASHLDRPVTLFSSAPTARRAEAEQALARTLEASDVVPDEQQVLTSDGRARSLADAGGEGPLVLGMSVDWLLGHAQLTGIPAQVVALRRSPTILVKAAEAGARLWARRLWQTLAGPLPTLSLGERTELFNEMRRSSRATVDFYTMIVLAATIATLGLALDSGAVIIGAMLVAPLMSPILAMAHGLILGNSFMLRRSAVSVSQGMGLALGVGVVAALWLPESLPTREMLARGEPSLLDLLVAVAAGAAAAYGISRSSVSASLPGVAISVALVPPLCVSGWALGTAEFALAGGAFLLFLTNLSAIVLVGSVTFVMLGVRPARAHRGARVRRALGLAVLAIALISIPLGFQSRATARLSLLESRLAARLEERPDSRYDVSDLEVARRGDGLVVIATLHLFEEDYVPDLSDLRRELERLTNAQVSLEVKLVPTRLIIGSRAAEEAAAAAEEEANALQAEEEEDAFEGLSFP